MPAAVAAPRRWTLPPRLFPRFGLGTEPLILATSLFWALALNRPFFSAVLRASTPGQGLPWDLIAALALALVALHALVLALLATRSTVKPAIAVLTLVGAFAMHYMSAYGTVIDPSMLRNALHTDVAEARELLSWSLALDLGLYALIPIALLTSVRIEPRPWRRALAARALLLGLAAAALGTALWWQFQPLAALMRNQRELRYLVTPANTLWSLGSALATDVRSAAGPHQPIGLDAAPGPLWATQGRPRLLVLVVGETARAANWGLNGYARQTTPQLARLPVLNFGEVGACGTSTEVSLPCMFAPVGRRDYDPARIQASESLLHVAARAGVDVHWRDNQSGCKGVCAGLPSDTVNAGNAPGLCQGDRCWDEGLLRGLEQRLQALKGGHATQLLVLHMLGNHGPSYFRRYPQAFERYAPACHDDDLGRCTREEIVNAYDNALLYTDHVLSSLIGSLAANAASVDSAMLFVSDHGESLGENHLYLHGMPYAIAPREQTQVPMVMWWSSGFGAALGLQADCLREQARRPAQHDHLFHTVLGLLDVQTKLYAPEFDLTQGCRGDAGASH
jgi:lipid A ethanolaminephosphotransferase